MVLGAWGTLVITQKVIIMAFIMIKSVVFTLSPVFPRPAGLAFLNETPSLP
jgi:hypothetical protein